jgi:hypothetical protein
VTAARGDHVAIVSSDIEAGAPGNIRPALDRKTRVLEIEMVTIPGVGHQGEREIAVLLLKLVE